ncbi:uncharacterized protein MELLADRAFT_71995 [Melampsora larici-populina 98AG31]|uniref:Uncharacterized protein n=1 Tax=Melampsora larici-populina (strain 98AG31 / pathotype 3-4-7) TaxID=747676 RepID=F4RNC7_MELLP|nr:uncharacterized protein MELLADRAFT_71995 [Melampsora larici-populina 98AG31]EGG05966.1 hypothetical protein MELLADRAFT_71995 [Melampsora larici-populina 98AG31]
MSKLMSMVIGLSMILIIRKLHDLMIDEILLNLKSIEFLCFKIDQTSLNRLRTLGYETWMEFNEIFVNDQDDDDDDDLMGLKDFKELVKSRSIKSNLNSKSCLSNQKLKQI